MLTEEKIDISSFDIKSLTPEQWDALRRRAIAEAHRTRSQMVAVLTRQLFTAIARAFAATFTATLARLARWHDRRNDNAAIARLHSLDDFALKDIGIQRTEIESIVHAHGNDDTRARHDHRLAA